jgi:hypothetical protein
MNQKEWIVKFLLQFGIFLGAQESSFYVPEISLQQVGCCCCCYHLKLRKKNQLQK